MFRSEYTVLIINAIRDFAEGVARGVSLFLTERRDHDVCFTIPEAALTKCLPTSSSNMSQRLHSRLGCRRR